MGKGRDLGRKGLYKRGSPIRKEVFFVLRIAEHFSEFPVLLTFPAKVMALWLHLQQHWKLEAV